MKEMIMWDKYDNKYREVVDVEVARGLEADLYEANNIISEYIDIVKQKDKIIDLMTEHIYLGCDFDNNIKTKEQIRKYFEERCKDANDWLWRNG